MAILTTIEPRATSTDDTDKSKLDLSVDVGKTLGGVILAAIILGISAWMYASELAVPAAAFFALGEAIVVGVLGIAVGEKSGAAEAERKLK